MEVEKFLVRSYFKPCLPETELVCLNSAARYFLSEQAWAALAGQESICGTGVQTRVVRLKADKKIQRRRTGDLSAHQNGHVWGYQTDKGEVASSGPADAAVDASPIMRAAKKN
jgi:hypothetical protein